MLGRTGLAVAGAMLAAAATAQAAPQAPGAPGATATWAPADKHGFATAHSTAGNAYLTLRQASASEVYFPDLSTPAFRGLQFAVVDKGTATRETVDDDPAHIEPVAPGVTARVRPIRGSLAFKQATETAKWRLTKTWITDPARPTVLARIRFESKTGRKLKLYVLADPAPGDDGDDDRGRGLVAWDDAAASAVAATPRLKGATSGYKGTRSDPWRQLERSGKLRRYDALEEGNVYQAARTALDGRKKQTMTLAIGFGAKRADAEQRARKSLRAGFAARAARYHAGWKGYVDSLADAPAPVASDPALEALYDQSLMVLAASEDKKFRGASIAAPNMPWEWGVTALDDKPESGPYHLVWPRDFYHVATAQKAAGDDEAATRLLDYLWKVQKADGSWWQNTRVNGKEYWTIAAARRDRAAHRPRLVAGPDERRRLGARREGRGLHHGEGAADRAGALGEPERLVAEHDRDRDRGAGHRGRHRAQERRRGEGGGVRGQGGRLAGARSSRGPRRPPARTRPSRTTCA